MGMLSLAFEDFILSREAMLCSPATIDFYRRMLKPFVEFTNSRGLSNRLVREFVASVADRGVASTTVHAHARALRAFLRFAYEEDWIEEPVTARRFVLAAWLRRNESRLRALPESFGDSMSRVRSIHLPD